jgi:hypothetical protein
VKTSFAAALSAGSKTSMYWVIENICLYSWGWGEPVFVRTLPANGSYCTDIRWWMRAWGFGWMITERGNRISVRKAFHSTYCFNNKT